MNHDIKKRNRRYYIHRRLKGIYAIRPRKRLIEIPAGHELPKLNLVMELITKCGHSAQYFIK